MLARAGTLGQDVQRDPVDWELGPAELGRRIEATADPVLEALAGELVRVEHREHLVGPVRAPNVHGVRQPEAVADHVGVLRGVGGNPQDEHVRLGLSSPTEGQMPLQVLEGRALALLAAQAERQSGHRGGADPGAHWGEGHRGGGQEEDAEQRRGAAANPHGGRKGDRHEGGRDDRKAWLDGRRQHSGAGRDRPGQVGGDGDRRRNHVGIDIRCRCRHVLGIGPQGSVPHVDVAHIHVSWTSISSDQGGENALQNILPPRMMNVAHARLVGTRKRKLSQTLRSSPYDDGIPVLAADRFERIRAVPRRSLLRATGSGDVRTLPRLLVDDGSTAHRFSALPGSASGDGSWTVAYAVPDALADRRGACFALELADGGLVDLPRPTIVGIRSAADRPLRPAAPAPAPPRGHDEDPVAELERRLALLEAREQEAVARAEQATGQAHEAAEEAVRSRRGIDTARAAARAAEQRVDELQAELNASAVALRHRGEGVDEMRGQLDEHRAGAVRRQRALQTRLEEAEAAVLEAARARDAAMAEAAEAAEAGHLHAEAQRAAERQLVATREARQVAEARAAQLGRHREDAERLAEERGRELTDTIERLARAEAQLAEERARADEAISGARGEIVARLRSAEAEQVELAVRVASLTTLLRQTEHDRDDRASRAAELERRVLHLEATATEERAERVRALDELAAARAEHDRVELARAAAVAERDRLDAELGAVRDEAGRAGRARDSGAAESELLHRELGEARERADALEADRVALLARVDELVGEVGGLGRAKEELARACGALEALEARLSEAVAERDRLGGELDAARQEVGGARRAREDLQGELEEVSQRLENVTASSARQVQAATERAQAVSRERDAAAGEAERLAAELERVAAAGEEARRSADREVRAARDQSERVSDELRASRAAMAEVEKRVRVIGLERSAFEQERDDALRRLEAVTAELRAAEDETARVTAELDRATAAGNELERALRSAERWGEELTQRHELAEATVAELRNQHAVLAQELAQVTQVARERAAEAEELRDRVQTLSASLEATMRAGSERERANAALTGRIAELEAELDRISAREDDQRVQGAERVAGLRREFDAAVAESAVLADRVLAAETDLGRARSELEERSRVEARLEGDLQASLGRLAELLDRHDDLATSHAASEERAELLAGRLELSLLEVEKLRAAYEAERDEREQAAIRLDQARSEGSRLGLEVGDLEARQIEMAREIVELRMAADASAIG